MSDFSGLLSSDYGFKPSGKSTPSNSKPPPFDHRSSNSFDNIFSAPFNLDSIYGSGPTDSPTSSNSGPVFDKPVYDDDIFDGVPGLKSSSTTNDIFDKPPRGRSSSDGIDDFLGGFTTSDSSKKAQKSASPFDDLLPGFGGSSSSPPAERSNLEADWPRETSANVSKTYAKGMEDPFGVSGLFNDPLEEVSRFSSSGSFNADNPSVDNGRVYDGMDPFDGLGQSIPSFSSGSSFRGKDSGNLKGDAVVNNCRGSTVKESTNSSVRSSENQSRRTVPVGNQWDSHDTLFDMPSVSTGPHKSAGRSVSPPSYVNTTESNVQADRSSRSDKDMDSFDDIWLTVSEIPLLTQPTSAPPPARPPPPRPVEVSKSRKKDSEPSNAFFQAHKSAPAAAMGSGVSFVDNLEEFAMGKSPSNFDEHANGLSGEELECNSVTDAVKDTMDRAEFNLRQARSARSKEAHEKEKERLHKGSEEEDMEQKRQEKEREAERVWEEKEREQRKLEKERERARELEEKNRQAVERATREARERAAAEARIRAEKAKAERAAVDRANAEARARAEKAAVLRAQSEARERAAAEAKLRAEKAAAEARERATAESKEREARERAAEAEARKRSERAAVERATAEARERASAATRANQQRNENDLENFFSMGRASSAPRHRAPDPFDAHFQSRQDPEVPKASTSSNIKKASSTTNIVDDLSSIFGAVPSSNDFQEVEGESEERRRARWERDQRTKERTVKALAEKNERDLQAQREQAERHRISETLDVEIKRWAAGKEGNLRALLSTMQYVLWPECGWQPVSLTDMITAAQVKKVYRKATLCIHPDKVQQKGANLQQKYVAEKVFDLLKEAWNKFNSEELF